MKKIRKQIEHLVLLFASLILLQSCAVYQRTPVSLEQASKQDVKAKIKTKTNETFLVGRIIFEDGRFYGIQKVNGKKIRITLHTNDINSIRLIETSPNIRSVLLPLITILALSGIIALSPGFP